MTEFCYETASPFSNSVAIVSQEELGEDYIDKTGKSIVPKGYSADSVGFHVSSTLYQVENAKGKIGYIDNKGNIVIDAIYDEGSCRFVYGVATVCKDGKEYCIDENENILFYIEKDAK